MSSPEERREEEIKIGAQSALGKITQAGYSSLDVRFLACCGVETDPDGYACS
jgi:obg-like ATPase 1